MRILPLGGRYPGNMAYYDKKKIVAEITSTERGILLRVEDTSNIDRWEEFLVPWKLLNKEGSLPLVEELKSMLRDKR